MIARLVRWLGRWLTHSSPRPALDNDIAAYI